MNKFITNTAIGIQTEKMSDVGVLIRKTIETANNKSNTAIVLIEACVLYKDDTFLTRKEISEYIKNIFFKQTINPHFVDDKVKEINLVIQKKGVDGLIETFVTNEVDEKNKELLKLFNFIPLTEETIARYEMGEIENLSQLHGKDTESMNILVEFTENAILYA